MNGAPYFNSLYEPGAIFQQPVWTGRRFQQPVWTGRRISTPYINGTPGFNSLHKLDAGLQQLAFVNFNLRNRTLHAVRRSQNVLHKKLNRHTWIFSKLCSAEVAASIQIMHGTFLICSDRQVMVGFQIVISLQWNVIMVYHITIYYVQPLSDLDSTQSVLAIELAHMAPQSARDKITTAVAGIRESSHRFFSVGPSSCHLASRKQLTRQNVQKIDNFNIWKLYKHIFYINKITLFGNIPVNCSIINLFEIGDEKNIKSLHIFQNTARMSFNFLNIA